MDAISIIPIIGMPELPEVETTLRGIKPYLLGQDIRELRVRERRLRYPIPEDTEKVLAGQRIQAVNRRGKYLLVKLGYGNLIIHLGMSGSIRIVPSTSAPNRHDHLDLVMAEGLSLRYRDPRRFGLFLWTPDPVEHHPLVRNLGPEPLGNGFNGAYLHELSRGRSTPVKNFIMDSKVVVGVGNIYANEALFLARLNPNLPADSLSHPICQTLAEAIRLVLNAAIEAGGTSLRDFVREDGNPGYFTPNLKIYGRHGKPCCNCGTVILRVKIGQRSSFFCPKCQPQ